MIGKFYKWFSISLVISFVIACVFFFVGCHKNNYSQSDVYDNIVNYIKKHGIRNNVDNNIYYFISNTADATNLSSNLNYIAYSEQENRLALTNRYSNFEKNKQSHNFIETKFYIPNIQDYSNYNYNVTANYGIYDTSVSTITHYLANLTLPATEYVSMETRIPLPEIHFDSTEILDSIKKEYRDYLTISLSSLLLEFNNFYVNKIENGNTNYTGMTFKYFYLPIIQTN